MRLGLAAAAAGGRCGPPAALRTPVQLGGAEPAHAGWRLHGHVARLLPRGGGSNRGDVAENR